MGRTPRRLAALTAALAALTAVFAALASPALAHEERDVTFPEGTGSVPQYRTTGPQLLVCKDDRADFERRVAGFATEARERNLALFDECVADGFRHLQQAVDAAEPGSNILVLPGLYQEEPSLEPPTAECTSIDAPWANAGGSGNDKHDRHRTSYQVLSFEQQVACPHEQNLVAILGKEGLQIEGTGEDPTDVVIDAQYHKLNTIRVDRADGFYLRNVTAQRNTFNNVYVMETDGFVVDTVLARWSDEYGFLSFANDHGLFTNCEGYGAGDAAIYPGSSSDINRDAGHEVDRYAIEITGCYAHHNLLGYSGTAGNSVWAHNNVFVNNGAGVAMDSAFTDHPGMPQNHARFERNIIGDNNEDYYRYVRDGTCLLPVAERGYEDGVVCPAVGLPAGTGVINPGGNYNLWRDNWIYGHSYAGFITSWVPAFIRGDTGLAEQFDTSHHNRYLGNRYGVTPEGEQRPNRIDFWWDGQGRGHCWDHASATTTDPLVMPACGADDLPAGLPVTRYTAEPAKLLKLYVCAEYSRDDQLLPGSCDWYGASGLQRVEVQLAAGTALLVGLALVGLWIRRSSGSTLAAIATALGVAGLITGAFGAAHEATPVAPTGAALFGAGAMLLGTLLRPRRVIGWLTVALGAVALLGAVDHGLVMIPLIPVPPSLLLLLLTLVWLPWAVVAMLRRPQHGSEPEPAAGPDTPAEPESAPAPDPDPAREPEPVAAPDPDAATEPALIDDSGPPPSR